MRDEDGGRAIGVGEVVTGIGVVEMVFVAVGVLVGALGRGRG